MSDQDQIKETPLHSVSDRLDVSPTADRLIRRDELKAIVPVSDPTLWRWERAGTFPKRITLARNLVAWRWSDIQAWVASKGQENH